jgi:hypothetical protein
MEATMKKLMIAAVLGVAACGGESESTETTSAAVSVSLEGTYDFLLEQSDVGTKLREECGGKRECWDEIQAEANKEKIRFKRGASGQLVFTSFAIEGAKEEVFLEAPVAVSEPSPGVYRGKLVGWPKGSLVAQLTRAGSEMKIERRADGTIAVSDPKKGRLVYRRQS